MALGSWNGSSRSKACVDSADSGRGHRGTIWAATGESPLGPFDIKGATPLTDDSFYVGKLVRDPSGEWVLLAFHNAGPDGDFVGVLSDPMPVRWDDDVLTVVPASIPTVDSLR